MAAGLFGLLDDVAALAKLAAASVDDIGAAASRAGMKSAGVVVDDTAVTPQYVHGVTAERELPIIRRIAVGSLRNKLLVILPTVLLLSQFLPVLITPLLMVGAVYLCFEGAEKLWAAMRGHQERTPAAVKGPEAEQTVVSGAVRTDFILSTEIMVIALNEVAEEPFLARAAILVVVAVGITLLVYGAVALIVKMDDVGLLLSRRTSQGSRRLGHALVQGMPVLLRLLSVVGVAAMLWVGGHILLVGVDDLGWHAPYDMVHQLEEAVHRTAQVVGGLLAWVVNTVASALIGLVVGAIAVAVWHVLPLPGRKDAAAH
jgi:predicted DNA repair protein MutK